MRTPRLATLCVALFAATLVSGAALAKEAARTAAPKDLRGFLLRPNEPVTHTFPRTPAFAWSPVRGARCYEFELATSRSFAANAVVWSNVQEDAKARWCSAAPADPGSTTGDDAGSEASGTTGSTTTAGTATGGTADAGASTLIRPVRVPAVSVDLVLPWFTGNPYALYARVRAITGAGPTKWSKPFGFNMRWSSLPSPLKAGTGLVRWSPIEGATGYQVWYPQLGKSFSTNSNVADLRDFYTFHRSDPSWWQTVRWRVRAVRRLNGTIPNGLPSVSFGQWSPVFTGVNAQLTTGKLRLVHALSDTTSTLGRAAAHELMPALSFRGDTGTDGQSYRLFRTYIATDRDCVNIVFRGSVVGSPAFAPRTTGPLRLPASTSDVAKAEATSFPHALPDADTEGSTFLADWRKVVASETKVTTSGSGSTTTTDPSTGEDESKTVVQARVDLPDIDFPSTRYYWTVVPVEFLTNPSDETKFGYVDVESPQDACQSGRVMSFGKESDPVQTGADGGTPFVSGLSPNGRLLTASSRRPVVYSTPLVAWRPVIGATAYQVQWSRSKYPWRAAGSVKTYATSALLDLAPGTWHYRVRGLNQTQLRRAEMAWSAPVRVKIARPTFAVVSG
jgi:hypothetical protein